MTFSLTFYPLQIVLQIVTMQNTHTHTDREKSPPCQSRLSIGLPTRLPEHARPRRPDPDHTCPRTAWSIGSQASPGEGGAHSRLQTGPTMCTTELPVWAAPKTPPPNLCPLNTAGPPARPPTYAPYLSTLSMRCVAHSAPCSPPLRTVFRAPNRHQWDLLCRPRLPGPEFLLQNAVGRKSFISLSSLLHTAVVILPRISSRSHAAMVPCGAVSDGLTTVTKYPTNSAASRAVASHPPLEHAHKT